MDLELRGKVAIVTAASKGMGKAVAHGLAREGAAVAICSRDQTSLEATAREIRTATGATVLAVQADVSVPADVERLVEAATAEFGGLDILVNNAGGPPPGNFGDFSDAEWEQAFNLTLMSVVRLCRAAVPHMRRRGGGRIVNITSISVKQPIEGLILSNGLRPGVVGLAKTLSFELGKDNILVNNVCPGRIATERLLQYDRSVAASQGASPEEVARRQTAGVPLGRYGKPEEVADLIVFLASARASYITGATIQVDGGMFRGLE